MFFCATGSQTSLRDCNCAFFIAVVVVAIDMSGDARTLSSEGFNGKLRYQIGVCRNRPVVTFCSVCYQPSCAWCYVWLNGETLCDECEDQDVLITLKRAVAVRVPLNFSASLIGQYPDAAIWPQQDDDGSTAMGFCMMVGLDEWPQLTEEIFAKCMRWRAEITSGDAPGS